MRDYATPFLYKKGPAGGYVFYEKGSVSDGWRYLEAAPASSEFNAQWGAYGKDVSGTLTGIGTGRANLNYSPQGYPHSALSTGDGI